MMQYNQTRESPAHIRLLLFNCHQYILQHPISWTPVLMYRGYYMAARGYEISSRVLKKYFTSERIERVKYFSTLEKKFRISKRPCKCSIYYINTNETFHQTPNHFTFRFKRRDLLCNHRNCDLYFHV